MYGVLEQKTILKNNIKIKVIDVTKDIKSAQDCAEQGCRGVPVVKISTKWICGFDKVKIERALGI